MTLISRLKKPVGIPKTDGRGFIRVTVEVTPQIYKEKLSTGIGWRGLIVRGIESMKHPINKSVKTEFERRIDVLQTRISELNKRIWEIDNREAKPSTAKNVDGK